MGLLKFTKNYSASDDGSSITGAEIGQLQADIAAIINGGISNINIVSDASIVESKLAFDTAAGHNHDGSNSRSLSAGGQRGYIQGAIIERVATDQVKAQSGVIEIGGTFYTRNSYSTTLDLDTAGDWVEGSSQRGTNKWVYVYAYNDTGSSWDIKLWLQPPQYANTGSDDSSDKIYRSNSGVWYRCLGQVRLNATGSGEIVVFYQRGNQIIYDVPIQVATTASAGAWIADVSCSIAIPATSQLARFGVYSGDDVVGNTVAIWLRPGDSPAGSTATSDGVYISSNGGTNDYVGGELMCATNSAQEISYYQNAGDNSLSITVKAYYTNLRN